MSMKKTVLCAVMIFVFILVPAAMASTFTAQLGANSPSAFDGDGNINWSGLFNSIEQYKPGSHYNSYTHSEDAAGGSAFADVSSGVGMFVGQGLSLASGGNPSGIGRHGNEKFSAVVAALAGCPGADQPGYNSTFQLRFETFGSIYSPRPVPLPGSLWFLFSGFGTLLAARRWRRK